MRTTVQTSVTGTDFGDTYAMAFDAAGTAHLMSILSNIYSDAPLAVLREYSANALDSHIEAGNPAPIEVELPNQFNPNLIIRDFGVGLSEDEIINVYSRYGKSTKGDTNEQIGAFGIGAKSAFTVGPQFVVTGIKGGQKTVALFSIGSDGVGAVSIVSRSETNEPNGVTVSIAIEDHTPYLDAARRLFSTWEPGTVLLDGIEPDFIWNDSLKITDDIYVKINDNGNSNVTLVMGGVGYTTNYNMMNTARRSPYAYGKKIGLRNNINIIAKIPMGSVDITPSREGLRDTTRTIETIINVLENFNNGVDEAINRMIQDEPSLTHAARAVYRLSVYGSSFEHHTWRGIDINFNVQTDMKMVKARRARRRGIGVDLYHNVSVELSIFKDQFIVVTGVDRAESTVRNVAKWHHSNGNYGYWLIAPAADSAYEWFNFDGDSPIKVMSWADLYKEYKENALINKGTYVAPRGERSYLTNDGYKTVKELLSYNRVIWAEGDYHGGYLFTKAFENDIVVSLSARHSTSLFTKLVTNAVHFQEPLDTYAKTVVSGLSEDQHRKIDFTKNSSMDLLVEIALAVGDITVFGHEVADYSRTKSTVVPDFDMELAKSALIRTGHASKASNNIHRYNEVMAKVGQEYPLVKLLLDRIGYGYYSTSNDLVRHAGLYVAAMVG